MPLPSSAEDTALLRLGEEQEHPRSSVSCQLIPLLVEALRNGQAVGVLVMRRLAIYEQHVTMAAVPGNCVERELPRIRDCVPRKCNRTPLRE